MTTNEKIGIALKELRDARGMSLEDLSKIIGKHRSTIHLYENGQVSISIPVLKSILNVYGISVGKFLDDIQ